MNSILLATSSAAFEQKVRRAFGFEADASLQRQYSDDLFLDPLSAAKQLTVEAPDVIAIGPNVPIDIALEVAEAIEEDHPEIGVILITEAAPDLWEKALHSGVRDVLLPDASDEKIRSSLTRVLDAAERRRRNLVVEVGLPDAAGRVITVIAPKGGVGKTALTTNVAVVIAAAGVGRVALVDLDLQFGDVGASLGLEPENTIADLARSPGGVTPTSLKVFMARWNDNLFALCAPLAPAEEVSEFVVDKAIRLLADDFDLVVVDTSAGISEPTLNAIDLSTDLVFVCDLSAASLRGLRKMIDVLDSLGVEEPTRYFVLNRADAKVGISPADASAIVGMKIDVEIPSSEIVPRSMNFGTPVVEDAPRSPVAMGFASVAGLFVDIDGNRKRKFAFGRSR